MTRDSAAFAGLPRGLPSETYWHYSKRLTRAERVWLHTVSSRLGHSTERYTFDTYLRAPEAPNED